MLKEPKFRIKKGDSDVMNDDESSFISYIL